MLDNFQVVLVYETKNILNAEQAVQIMTHYPVNPLEFIPNILIKGNIV